VLSRELAESGHYPAIDIEASISRALPALLDARRLEQVRRFKAAFSRYQRNRDLISVGAYSAGSDPLLDRAIEMMPRLEAYLRQDMRTRATHEESLAGLRALYPEEAAAAAA